MLLYFICSVQNDEKQFGNFFLDFFFGTELLVFTVMFVNL